MSPGTVAVRVGWVCLLVVGVGVLVFGVLAACFGRDPLLRADGVALTGMGLFGVVVTLIPFRRRERWAWLVLWFYPLFWSAHLVGQLPPGKDHVHQVVFIVLSLVGLVVPTRAFWGAGALEPSDRRPRETSHGSRAGGPEVTAESPDGGTSPRGTTQPHGPAGAPLRVRRPPP